MQLLAWTVDLFDKVTISYIFYLSKRPIPRKKENTNVTYALRKITLIIIHQIFLLTHDWPKRVTWPNIPQLKLWNIREYSPIFKTALVVKKIWRIIKTIVAIWGENMLGYLSLDIICPSQLTVFLKLRSRKTVRFSEQIMSADKYPCIFSRQMATIVYVYKRCPVPPPLAWDNSLG